MTFYCSADSTGPLPSIDWRARQADVSAIPEDGIGEDGFPITTTRDAAQDALNAERIGTASHFARNGNGPRTVTESPASVALYLASGARVAVGSPDEHGGGVASLVRADGSLIGVLRCPECGEPARAVDEVVPP